uniref:B30.2/SPRY domain-containing protein n=1 Tax=Globodera rostochiensis TaxID=31243 RepID=A0A914ID95_GLORO
MLLLFCLYYVSFFKGTSQLKGELSAKMAEEFQNQQQQNIDALPEARKGNARADQWGLYDLFRIAGTIALLIFIIYTALQLTDKQKGKMAESLKSVKAMVVAELGIEKMNEMRLKMAESLKSVQAMVVAELENDPYRIAGIACAIVLLIFVIYTVHRLNAQNAIVVAELEEQKQSNANKFAELEQQKLSNANKFVEIDDILEKYQKEQQLNISYLLKLGLINRWDSDDCHDNLALSEPGQLVVQHNGENSEGWSSVLAENRLLENPFGISYFEVKIIEKISFISIGLATERMPLDEFVGYHEGTYGYGSDGTFLGHEVEGCTHVNGRPFIDGKPSFEKDDVVGCGVKNGQIIYALNEQRLDTDGLLVESADNLFPCVTLRKKLLPQNVTRKNRWDSVDKLETDKYGTEAVNVN